jgi:hypothetical protein
MGLILLEALGAGLVLILIVWWTMFSGRNKGELHEEEEETADDNESSRPTRPPEA